MANADNQWFFWNLLMKCKINPTTVTQTKEKKVKVWYVNWIKHVHRRY